MTYDLSDLSVKELKAKVKQLKDIIERKEKQAKKEKNWKFKVIDSGYHDEPNEPIFCKSLAEAKKVVMGLNLSMDTVDAPLSKIEVFQNGKRKPVYSQETEYGKWRP